MSRSIIQKSRLFFTKHKSKERTILSFKRALFQGNDQSGNNEIGKWLKHLFGLNFLCPSDAEDSFCEDVHYVLPCRKIIAVQNMQTIYLNLNYVTSHSKCGLKSNQTKKNKYCRRIISCAILHRPSNIFRIS